MDGMSLSVSCSGTALAVDGADGGGLDPGGTGALPAVAFSVLPSVTLGSAAPCDRPTAGLDRPDSTLSTPPGV